MFRSCIPLFLFCIQGLLGMPDNKTCRQSDVEWIFRNRPSKKSAILQANNVQFKQCVLQCYNTHQCSNAEKGIKFQRNVASPQTGKWNLISVQSEKDAQLSCYQQANLSCGLSPTAPENYCRKGWKLQCHPTKPNTPYCVCDPEMNPNGCAKACSYIFRNKWDYPTVGDIQSMEVGRAEECLDNCQMVPGCASVVYNVINKKCWAKNINEFTAPNDSLVITEYAELYSMFCPI